MDANVWKITRIGANRFAPGPLYLWFGLSSNL